MECSVYIHLLLSLFGLVFHLRPTFPSSLDDLSIDVQGVLKFPTLIMLLSVSPFRSVNNALYIFWCYFVRYIYILINVMSS